MKTFLSVATAAVVTLSIGAIGGYWVTSTSNTQAPLLSMELRKQQAELARLQQAIAGIDTSSAPKSVHCPDRALPASIPQEAALESALSKTLEKRDEEARLVREAQLIPSGENLAAYAQAQKLLEEAAVARSWTDKQAAMLSQLLPRATGAQAETLLKQLAVALNEGQIALQTSGPPF
jgi:HPt (histidine-containing phosphotransfer) domain-containing protein